MAALIDVDEFKTRFDIDEGIEDSRITPHIVSASKRLRQWVGDTNYDAALALIEGNETDDDALVIVEVLQNAESHLTYHYALLGWHFTMSGKGIYTTATAAEGKEVRRYLSPKETQELSTQFLEMAESIAGPYIQATDTPIVTVIEADDTDQEGATRNASD